MRVYKQTKRQSLYNFQNNLKSLCKNESANKIFVRPNVIEYVTPLTQKRNKTKQFSEISSNSRCYSFKQRAKTAEFK